MKSSPYILITIVHICSIVCVCSHQDPGSSCVNHERMTNEATPESEQQAEDGYCDASRAAEFHSAPRYNCLRAAVVDYSRIDALDCKTATSANLEVYEEIARLAKESGANMVLFPEDGIFMGTAEDIFPCLEEIPNPEHLSENYNPCLQPSIFNREFPILNRLSCLARQHGIYLIANYGTREKKESVIGGQTDGFTKEGSIKDDSKYMMLNTDVIFNPIGRFIKRYRKWNPFTESEVFAKAPKLEHVYFDTEYGRFGVFTCFDMIFREPAVELVERYRIDTALFPTWWFDELPLLTAVQYQDGWSSTNNVSLLASNILKPSRGSLGSSIFSGNNSVYVVPEHYKSINQARKTKLLLGTIQTRQTGQACEKDFNPKIIEIDSNINYDKYEYKNYKLHPSDAIQVLDKETQGTKTVCSGVVCCTVEFKINQSSDTSSLEKLAIFVRDGPRPGFYQWYEQVCALATLKAPYTPSDKKTLENLRFDADAVISFDRLTIKATFGTKYVYPSCSHNLSKLVNREQRKFTCNPKTITKGDEKGIVFDCELEYLANKKNSESNKINSFGLYGRVYEGDKKLSNLKTF